MDLESIQLFSSPSSPSNVQLITSSVFCACDRNDFVRLLPVAPFAPLDVIPDGLPRNPGEVEVEEGRELGSSGSTPEVHYY